MVAYYMGLEKYRTSVLPHFAKQKVVNSDMQQNDKSCTTKN